MIVAGLGFRTSATAAHIEAALDAALATYGIARSEVSRLATLDRKAASLVSSTLPVDALSDTDLAPFAARCLSQSEASLRETGVPSLAEAAALCAAERASGRRARLLGPRIATEAATCALATTAPEITS